MEHFPHLPVEEEGRLKDPHLRENWVSRVFAYYHFHQMSKPRKTRGNLVNFHSRFKFTVLSHCHKTYRELGRIVAKSKERPLTEVFEEYERLFRGALKKRATPAKHVNVMEHLAGFFKKELDSRTRAAIGQAIKDYRKGYVTLIVPITLIKHYAMLLDMPYVQNQSYLNPHPKELGLLSII